jgi:hypothetical protein
MSKSTANERYEGIVDAGLTFFTILVGLKLADLIDRNSLLAENKWPCFVIGVAAFFRYVTGSFVHQRAQHVNQPEKHDWQFLFDFAFLIAFGIIAVWACVAESVPDFLDRSMRFTFTALAWTCGYLLYTLVARARGRASTFKYSPWLVINAVQFYVFWRAQTLWPPAHPTFGVFDQEFQWLWKLSAVSVLLLFVDLCFQLRAHTLKTRTQPHGAHSP